MIYLNAATGKAGGNWDTTGPGRSAPLWRGERLKR